MARLFPFRSETAAEEGKPRVVDLEGEDADAVFAALSSTTAREIYARLDEDPATPSDIADAIDSSIQNVRYHLEKLENAGLVEVVDTWYSSRGNEMSVYATTDGPLIVTSDESKATKLKEALSRLIGGVGALAGGSVLVQYALTEWLAPSGSGTGADAGTTSGGDSAASEDGTSPTDSADAADDESVDDAEPTSPDDGASDGSDADGGDFQITENDDTEPTGAESNGTDADGADQVDPVLDADNETVQNASDGALDAADAVFDTVPPGLLFFLGGLVVLLAVTAYWYWYRPTY
ncbi:ArsR/SmtB family transcription factor [Natrinema salifodinae]|uniref:Transcriptional regulator, ArsR family n=1 Tax=Natrinema salifodinae TaxID=1202768 RepID=A0A1I0PHY4_9EURY|nr:helix-turn-helix domain-containing protein [Natrinema salifodinae]SEW14028.1 transcriptional regulator, ArsR family [Natrinema salifodinae]